MAIAFPFLKPQFFKDSGEISPEGIAYQVPNAGGYIETYSAGTLDQLPTYTTATGDVENTDPIVLDGAGRANIFLDPDASYFFRMFDADGNQIWTEDNISGAGGTNSGVVLTTTDQEVSGTKIWLEPQGFGDGSVEEYQSSSFGIISGSQSTINAGIQIVGTGQLDLQMGSNEIGTDAAKAGIRYVTSTQTLTLRRNGSAALTLTDESAAFVAPIITADGVAVRLATDVVAIAQGGTGQITAAAALNALLPSQAGQAGNYLISDGTNVAFGTSAGGPTFLAAPYQFFSGQQQNSWTTYDSSNAGVPSGAKAIIIEAITYIDTFDKAAMHYACLRVDNTKGNTAGQPQLDTYILGAAGTDASHYTAVGGMNQGTYPLRVDRTFDYIVQTKFLLGCQLRIIGYVL